MMYVCFIHMCILCYCKVWNIDVQIYAGILIKSYLLRNIKSALEIKTLYVCTCIGHR